MKKQLINGILYSKYDAEMGPVPEAWTPDNLSLNIRNLVSQKSVKLLVGQHGTVPEDLAFFPFPSLNMKGLIRNLEIPSPEAGNAVDGALTVLFSEGNDSIYYKYLDNLKENLNNAAEKLIKLEDDTLIEVEVSADQAQPMSGGLASKVNTTFDKIRPVLINICRPVVETWNEINQEMDIEQAEIELGLSFEGEGNLFVTKSKAGANLTIKLVLIPKKAE